jgi:hypothetical protein
MRFITLVNGFAFLVMVALSLLIAWSTGGGGDSWLRFFVRLALAYALVQTLLNSSGRLDILCDMLLGSTAPLPTTVQGNSDRLHKIERSLAKLIGMDMDKWYDPTKSAYDFGEKYAENFHKRMARLYGQPDFLRNIAVSVWAEEEFLLGGSVHGGLKPSASRASSILKATVPFNKGHYCLANVTIEEWRTHLVIHSHTFTRDEFWQDRKTYYSYWSPETTYVSLPILSGDIEVLLLYCCDDLGDLDGKLKVLSKVNHSGLLFEVPLAEHRLEQFKVTTGVPLGVTFFRFQHPSTSYNWTVSMTDHRTRMDLSENGDAEDSD